jgi:hypothetical protein
VHHLEDVCSRLRGFVVEESVVLLQTCFAFVKTRGIDEEVLSRRNQSDRLTTCFRVFAVVSTCLVTIK